MASLWDAVKDYQDELRDGIAWVAFWREGRSWKSEYFYLDMDDTIPPEDLWRLKEARDKDPAAVALNAYYCGHLAGDMNLDELAAGVRWHYENGYNLLSDFIESRSNELTQEEIEQGRAAAHAAGLPFSEKPYRDGDFDPYVFDGSMSVEDYGLMHRMIAEERSRDLSEAFSILIDSRSRHDTGEPGGVWLPMPTTTEQLHAAMRSVGITADNPQDFFINGFADTEAHPFDVPLSVIQSASVDELNYLGKLLEMQPDEDRDKFAAAVTLGERAGNIKDLINLAQNLDCYWLYPGVQNEEDYGYYLIDELDELELPEEAKKYFMYEDYGRDAAINDGGMFTEQGYVYNNKNTFTEWYNGRETDIPKEYRVMGFPEPERPDPEKVDFDTISTRQAATLAAEPPQPVPVRPIVLTSEKPAEKLKEITDRLEQGITELFESERYREYLQVMSKFHNYSFNNTLLIAMQKPDASLVAGFSAWKNTFKRNVVKGEKGIKIIAPSPFKIKREVEKIDPQTQQPVIGRDGKPVTEEKEVTIPAYKVVSVFDVSQTEGRELPNIGVDMLTGDVEQYRDFFAALEKTSPVPISFEKIAGGAHGYYHLEEKRIAIDEGMSELQTLKTAIHEIAHAKLHDIDLNAPKEERGDRPDRRTREVQAESVAYTVCQHYGLDTSDYSFGYVAGWSSGRELAELKASLETIRSAAAEIINGIDAQLAELKKDREQAAGQEQPQEQETPEKGSEEQEQPAPQEPETEKPEPEAAQEETMEPEPQEEPPQPEAAAPEKTPEQAAPETSVHYYPINEAAARRAKEAISFSDYKPGSATAEYRHYVDEAAELAARQKKRVDPSFHEKIDSLLDTYARKLAANMNKGYEITARVPSIMIAGGSNFPVRKKEKQNAAADKNMQEFSEIQGLLDKIRSTGMGGISADDPAAVSKLKSKLAKLEKAQETMKAVNAYYRKHKTLDGCPAISPEQAEKLKSEMASQWHIEEKPYPTWALSNNNAEIRRVKERIASLTKQKEMGYVGWEFDGGKVEANTADNRLQIFFDGKPDPDTRADLKGNGFKWAPSAGAWQRQLNDNAIYAADRIKAIQPLTGERPTELQRRARQETQEQPQDAPREKEAAPEYIYKMEANPRSDSADDRFFIQAYLPLGNGRAEIGDVLFIGTAEKCRELMEQLNTGELTQGQVKELYAQAQEAAQAAEPDRDSFTIYQLKDGDETRDFRFEPYDRLQAAGLAVDPANYEAVYTAPLSPDMSLEDIYTRFNIDHPKDFTGHSLSVSDVVVLHQSGQDAAHYVDSFGFRQVPEFLQEQPQQEKPAHTAGELEAKARAGEQISLAEYAAALKAEKPRGKDKEEKPSIRAQLKAVKEKAAQKKPARSKSQDLERS